MTANETAIRKAYQVAEDKDISGWVNCFTEDGTFTDESVGVSSNPSTAIPPARWSCRSWECCKNSRLS